MSDGVSAPHLFTLTEITGRRKTEDREMIIMSMEIRVRHVWVFAFGLLPALLVTALAVPFLGIWSIPVPVIVLIIWFTLVERRSKDGLRTRTWQTILDKRRTLAGQMIQCGKVVTDDMLSPVDVMRAAIPVIRDSSSEAFIGLTDDALPPAPAPRQTRRRTPRKPRPVTRSQPSADLDLEGTL